MVCKWQHGTNELLEVIQEGGTARLAVKASGSIGVMQESACRMVVIYGLGFDDGALARDAGSKLVARREGAGDWRNGRGRAASSLLQQFLSLSRVWKGILQSLFVKVNLLFEVVEFRFGDGDFLYGRRVYTLAIGRGARGARSIAGALDAANIAAVASVDGKATILGHWRWKQVLIERDWTHALATRLRCSGATLWRRGLTGSL